MRDLSLPPLRKCYKPEVVSPLGVVPKGKEGKFRLIINMSNVNDHLVTNKFKFEGLSDLSDLAEKLRRPRGVL